MLFSKATIFTTATTLAGLVSAQNTKVHVVEVGASGLKFTPESIDAAVGDHVQFQFHAGSHSVARSDFANPCAPLDPAVMSGGFFSGFMPVKSEDKYMPTFTVLVNETAPIWFYCATAPHCERGMVGVINPPKNSDKTLDKFKAAAAQSKTVVPGSESGGDTDPDGPSGPKPPTPGNTGNPGNTNTTTPTGNPNTNTTTPTGSPNPSGNSTGTTTGAPGSTETPSKASSFFASAASVVLGAVAVAAFLI